jgi:rhodanese-related sulfurtransferase
MTAAVTGLNEKNAALWNIPYIKSYTHSANHAEYYPGAYPVSIKTIFSPYTGKLLGAQIIGKHGVDKRIDVFAAAIRNGLSVTDLTELELAYAPPFGSAKDPLNIAGFVAQNIITKRMKVIYPEEIEKIDNEKQLLLDVRTRMEHKANSIEKSMHIPVDELRNRLNELDRQKEIVVYCEVGYRGYIAARILVQNGYNAKNLSGGIFTYLAYMNKL